MVIRLYKPKKNGEKEKVYYQAVVDGKLKTTKDVMKAYEEGDGYFLHAEFDWLKFHFPEEMKDAEIYDDEYDEVVEDENGWDEDEEEDPFYREPPL